MDDGRAAKAEFFLEHRHIDRRRAARIRRRMEHFDIDRIGNDLRVILLETERTHFVEHALRRRGHKVAMFVIPIYVIEKKHH